MSMVPTKGFPWRTATEIDTKRQKELRKCRASVPAFEKGMFPSRFELLAST